MGDTTNLEEIRAELDELDNEMLELFKRRMSLSADVARYKEARGIPTFRPQREKEIIDEVKQKTDPELSEYAADFFLEIMRLSRKYQESLRSGGKDF